MEWNIIPWSCHGGLENSYGDPSQISFSLGFTCTQKSERRSPWLNQVAGVQVLQQVSLIIGKTLERVEENFLVLFLELPPYEGE